VTREWNYRIINNICFCSDGDRLDFGVVSRQNCCALWLTDTPMSTGIRSIARYSNVSTVHTNGNFFYGKFENSVAVHSSYTLQYSICDHKTLLRPRQIPSSGYCGDCQPKTTISTPPRGVSSIRSSILRRISIWSFSIFHSCCGSITWAAGHTAR